jgi:heptaprenyl diphosphate synthase
MKSAKKIALCALLTALALTLSYAESFLPLSLLIPVPGLKLGLTNIVTLAALYLFGFVPALAITLARCFLGAFYAFGPMSLWFSLCGAVLALCVMTLLKRCRGVSIWGVSIAGAAAHNLGQILAASVVMQSTAVFAYLPVLLCASVVTGAAVAAAVAAPMARQLRIEN